MNTVKHFSLCGEHDIVDDAGLFSHRYASTKHTSKSINAWHFEQNTNIYCEMTHCRVVVIEGVVLITSTVVRAVKPWRASRQRYQPSK